MKLSEILQALANQYLPHLSQSLNTESDASVRLFYGNHEITSFDFQTLSLNPKVTIKRQSELIQTQMMHFIQTHQEKFSEKSSRSEPLPLERSYLKATNFPETENYLDTHEARSDEQYTYVEAFSDCDNSVFSLFLRLALLQRIGLAPEINHPFISFPLATELDIKRSVYTSKFPLRRGKTLRDLIKSSELSYSQWLNILISLHLILEQLTYLGLCPNISFDNLEILDTGYLKLIYWEEFLPTLDDSNPDLMGYFGAINYLFILPHIIEKLGHSSNLSSEEHASLLSLTLNIMEVLRSNQIRFENKRLPSQEELTTLSDEVLRALQTSLRMPTFQESLSQIFHSVDIPYAQKQRIFHAPLFTPNLSEMTGRIDRAIEIGFREFIELLLVTKTIEPDQTNERGETLLFRICRFTQKSSYELLDALLTDKFKTKVNPNTPDNTGNTPLIADILNPHNPGSNLTKLLKMGANPNLTNHKGDSPLHIACALPPSDGSISLYVSSKLPLLDTLQSIEECLITPQSSQNNVPSSEAINIVQTLLASGANSFLPNHQRLSPLDISRQSGFTSLSRILLEKQVKAKS